VREVARSVALSAFVAQCYKNRQQVIVVLDLGAPGAAQKIATRHLEKLAKDETFNAETAETAEKH